jgi:hypothetical protein
VEGGGGDLVGVMRDGNFIKKLTPLLVGTPVVVQHQPVDAGSPNCPTVVGYIKSANKIYHKGETFCVGTISVFNPDVINEVATQLTNKNYAFLPVSLAYHPVTEREEGTWVDSLGLLGESGESIPFSYRQSISSRSSMQVNHLAIVDFGRGGPVAASLCTKVEPHPPTALDSLYPNPQVRLNKDPQSHQKDRQKVEKTEDKYTAMCDAIENMQKLMGDMMAKMDAMVSMRDTMDNMKMAQDELCMKLGGLLSAIQRAYEGDDELKDQTTKAVTAVQEEGERRSYIFSDEAMKAFSELHQPLMDAVSKLLTAQAEATDASNQGSASFRQTRDNMRPSGVASLPDGSAQVL